ncbi:MAG: single-stranded-DNA-specific exonuclease RecJ [Bryobacterales bacterium]|nr:single-stranded-DNA-specific exonuclease RecJ [Bryobacterales bacterium]
MTAPNRPARWLISPEADWSGLSRNVGLSPLAAKVLAARLGPDPVAARRFLDPGLDDLHPPHLMHGMDAAVSRLRRAIGNGEKVLVYGDYDVDGATSIVLLKTAIELAGGQADFHVPHRLRDGYGMQAGVIEDAAAQGFRLVISVDTGIRAAEAVRAAAAAGIDVIVTDHHLPEAELPPALAVLNPNQPGCPYPEKNLCGVGVAFKLAQALFSSLGWPAARQTRLLDSFLKLVAIGTVADVVPLTGENRIIVKHGLAGLSDVRNPGLRALLDVAGFGNGTLPSASHIAFRVAPRINAAGRMDTARQVIEMFLTSDAARAREIAEQLNALNAERQLTEREIIDAITASCESEPVADDMTALVFAGEGWHRGVLGIVASRMVERFHRPAFVLGIENGSAQGSGRSVPGFHLLDALESMPDVFTKFGGHVAAAGLTLDSSRVDEFRTRLNAYASSRLSPADFVPTHRVDAIATLDEIHETAAADLARLAPFGFGNPLPVFCARGVSLAGEPRVIKEKHLRLPIAQGGRVVMMMGWNQANRVPDLPRDTFDVLFTVEDDPAGAARGYQGWSVILKDFR